jgi:hypothetical protein
MKKNIHLLLLFVAIIGFGISGSAQEQKKITFIGAARALYYGDDLQQETEPADTITVPKLNSGHVMVDLGMNIRPNRNTEILGMVRVRNDYGGFWGSGVTFDIRQLYVKGVIGGIVRYQLGDINYKMSPYTLWNQEQEVISDLPFIFQQQTDLINYDHFYSEDNSWRQQGAAAEFALVFKNYVDELQFHAVTTRVKASDFGQNSDRLFSGLNVLLVQSKFVEAGINFTDMYDVWGTSRNTSTFHNPVVTGTLKVEVPLKEWILSVDAETGKSKTRYKNNAEAPIFEGSFIDIKPKIRHESSGFSLALKTSRIGEDFRSPGAQTKRINYNALPVAYQRITNEQDLRPLTMMDLMRESSFYNMQLQPYLMDFSPAYDNITPYGAATPNRQGYELVLNYESAKFPLKGSISTLAQQEVRGEGTVKPREFSRTKLTLESDIQKFFADWKKMIHVSISYRDDQTTREGEELVKGVELNTTAMSAGLEIEFMESCDLLLGYQMINYEGFDYTAVRNTYSEIFNFSEYTVNGTQKMSAFGLRYRFSEKSYLSAQYNTFTSENEILTLPNYTVNQFMLMFQMKF